MIRLEDAIQLDIKQKIEDASKIYELLLKQANPNLEVFINLACLYWEVTDYGFNSAKNLPDAFVHKAGAEMYKLLDKAERIFGKDPEIEFWRLYFNFTTLGGEPFPSRALELAEKKKDFLVPYFHVYDQSKDAAYLPQVKKLLNQAQKQLTTKNRYIVSILASNNIE